MLSNATNITWTVTNPSLFSLQEELQLVVMAYPLHQEQTTAQVFWQWTLQFKFDIPTAQNIVVTKDLFKIALLSYFAALYLKSIIKQR
jgi:hypothetical protein